MQPSNKDLYDYKRNLLISVNNLELVTEFFDYYNCKIKINTTSDFLILIKNTLPTSFISGSKDHDLTINIYPQTTMSSNEFEDESVPDCFIENHEDCIFAIQRDFAAKRKGDEHTVYINKEVEDGYFNALRWILPRYLLKKKSLILHSSCVVDSNKAYLFLGHSGHGKTTTAELSQPRLVLGDDMNILSFDSQNQVYMQSGAIGGQIVHSKFNEKFPLCGVFWLKKGSDHSLKKLSPSDGLVKLSASAANLFWGNPETSLADLLTDITLEVLQKVPIYELTFKKDNNFWNVINNELS